MENDLTNDTNSYANPEISETTRKKIEQLIADDQASQSRTLSYYDNLKRSNPKLYLDEKIRKQMDKDALLLGSKFFDKDD